MSMKSGNVRRNGGKRKLKGGGLSIKMLEVLENVFRERNIRNIRSTIEILQTEDI